MTPKFRRGFKAEVDDLVRDVRGDAGVRLLDPLDPFAVARSLKIPVIGTSECGDDLCRSLRLSTLAAKFHAGTLRLPRGVAIVHNDDAVIVRQRANIAHELGHIFLEHEEYPVNTDDGLARDVNVEREADWFGFALLIPTEAALALARSFVSDADAAAMFGVSIQAARFRLDASGAWRRAAAEARRQR